jgi:hypothetical protein
MNEIITKEMIEEIIRGSQSSVKSILSENDPRRIPVLNAMEFFVMHIINYAVLKQNGTLENMSRDEFYKFLEPHLKIFEILTEQEFQKIFQCDKAEFMNSLEF